MDEKKPQDVQELTDEQLEATSGGAVSVKKFGSLYVFRGGAADMNKAFTCPKCFKALRYYRALNTDFFRCDACGVNYTADTANPNFGCGLWMKFS